MPRVQPAPLWQRAVIMLSGTVVGLVIVLALIWARPVLIPIALAVLMTFLLNPLVRVLQRQRLGRLGSVMVTVSIAGVFLLGAGWLATREVASVLAELPQNTANIKSKVQAFKRLGSGGFIRQFETMFEEISQETHPPAPVKSSILKDWADIVRPPGETSPVADPTRTVSIPWMTLTGYLGSAMEVLGTLAFSMVLLVFFLLGREDMRDRIVLLAGKARLALTSKALEDVTDRITRYIVMVALLNGGYGIMMAIGLYCLQVPNAFLWGFLSGGLRFIPYLGPWIGAIFPVAMSLAVSDGWVFPIAVIAFIAVLELVSNNVIEPLTFGHSTGVSPTALIILAAFWMYLWGPIGLVLSAPIAVCLVVVGKTIPQLGFLNLLLGEGPALRANVGLYQRLMLGDQMESNALVLERMKGTSPDEVYDELLIPSLNYTRRDVNRDQLTDEDQKMILMGMRNILVQADEFVHPQSVDKQSLPDPVPEAPELHSTTAPKPPSVLGCPARDDTDDVGLEMLRQLLDPSRCVLEVTAVETLVSELVARLAEDPPATICIASLPPGGISHARYLCKRLREAAPGIPIIVGRWGPNGVSKLDRERLVQAGASSVTTTLLETRKLIEFRILLSVSEPMASNTA